MANSQTTEQNQWKETIRNIYDMMHGRRFGTFCLGRNSKETANAVIGLIEERHHDYFCEGHEI